MKIENATPWSEVSLVRQLGLFDTSMIVVGIVIGSGIFMTTGILAKWLPSAPLILLAWVVGGLLTMAGALTFAELGAAMPEAGGLYVYLRQAYGRLAGFMYGWICFLVYQTGTIAALAMAFAEFVGFFFPSLSLRGGQLVAVSTIVLLTALNYLGVSLGKWVQNVLTLLKIGTLLVLVVLGIANGASAGIDFSWNPHDLTYSQLLMGFGVAQIAIAWAFGGWSNVNYVAGEIKNPQRTLPLALIVGALIVTFLYIATNYVYLHAVPLDEMIGTVRIAEKATSAMLGGATAAVISAAALAAVLGSLNGVILSGPRVFYAMARDKLFFQAAARVHSRFRTPGFALVLQAAWASLLCLTGSFEQLLTFTMFVAIIFWIAGAVAVPVLRRKYPNLPRPYKTWGYPVLPAVFVIACTGILINTLLEKPVEALAGVALMLAGIPAYLYWARDTATRSPDVARASSTAVAETSKPSQERFE